MNETSSIRNLKGIGEKTEKLFARVGVKTVGDLLAYYPRGYDVYREPVAIGQVKDQERAAVTGTVSGSVEVKRTRNLTVISTVISDLTGRCRLTWFNMPFLVNTLKRGSTFVFRGKVVFKGNLRVMEHPEIYTPAAYQEKQDSMQPIYGLTAGLTNNQVTKAVRQALENLDLSRDYLPEELRLQEGLAEYNFALSQIHFPKDQECYITARNRLAFDEFLLFILGIQRLKEKTGREENHYRMKEVWKTEEVMENLPYQLTGAQKNVWYEIERDLKGEKLMARLVQGDVGSGKTIIAFLAMIMAAENGYQSAVMAPTEVLARQHYEALEKLLGENGMLDVCRPVLLVGSCTAAQKRRIYRQIASGEARMIVGTHALIQEKVEYENLALVITDEQHRFGVRQRETFSRRAGAQCAGDERHAHSQNSGDHPLRGSGYFRDRRASRQKASHQKLCGGCRMEAEGLAFHGGSGSSGAAGLCDLPHGGRKRRAGGGECDGLCPAPPPGISPADPGGDSPRADAPAEKNQVMEDFAAGRIQILVSTTVVEVGVNVPNATVMTVENAERFGLAQLHQLRGRVGRGEHQSYCIFIQGNGKEETSRRLKILSESNDGFYIAEEDLKLRGPGDLFGVRQSGLLEFGVADIYRDAGLMKRASQAAGKLLELDFELKLPQNQALGEKLVQYMSREEGLGL